MASAPCAPSLSRETQEPITITVTSEAPLYVWPLASIGAVVVAILLAAMLVQFFKFIARRSRARKVKA